MKKLNTVFIIFLVLFIASCKKESLNTKKTFDELMVLIKTDGDIANFKSSTYSIMYLKVHDMETKSLSISSIESKKMFSNVKNETDLKSIFENLKINNSEELVKNISMQIKSMENFVGKYPEIKGFTEIQKTAFLKELSVENILKQNYAFYKLDRLMSLNTSLDYKKIALADPCLYEFNMSIRACDIGYGAAIATIWIDVIFAAPETMGTSLAAGLLMSGIAYLVYNECYNMAGSALDQCAYAM